MPKTQIISPKLRQPSGHFSHATMVAARGRLVFISGMTARRADGSIAGVGDIEAQTRQGCDNVSVSQGQTIEISANGHWVWSPTWDTGGCGPTGETVNPVPFDVEYRYDTRFNFGALLFSLAGLTVLSIAWSGSPGATVRAAVPLVLTTLLCLGADHGLLDLRIAAGLAWRKRPFELE